MPTTSIIKLRNYVENVDLLPKRSLYDGGLSRSTWKLISVPRGISTAVSVGRETEFTWMTFSSTDDSDCSCSCAWFSLLQKFLNQVLKDEHPHIISNITQIQNAKNKNKNTINGVGIKAVMFHE